MLKHSRISRRFLLPLALAISLLFAFVPAALVATHAQSPSLHLFGPKQHYLALGDSLAFGFQPCLLTNPPTCSKTEGYAYDLFQTLKSEGAKDITDLGCPSESSTTFMNGGICSYSPFPSQLKAAEAFLQANPGKVSPVTLDIGANDVFRDINPSTCVVNVPQFNVDLTTLDNNLTGTILPGLLGALTVNGRPTGSIVMMNYYNPFPNCLTNPDFAPAFTAFDTALANDVSGFGTLVDVLDAFGGITTPNLCTLTWICGTPPSPTGPDIHPRDPGYSVIANTFAAVIPPS